MDADGNEAVSESPRKTEPEAALPKRGTYGMNVILKIAENFLQRMPHRMSAKSLRRHLTRMSHGTSPQHSVHDRHESGRSGQANP